MYMIFALRTYLQDAGTKKIGCAAPLEQFQVCFISFIWMDCPQAHSEELWKRQDKFHMIVFVLRKVEHQADEWMMVT